jgi:hypothetical protein
MREDDDTSAAPVMIVQRRELKDQQKSRSLATIDTNNPYRIKPQLRRGRGSEQASGEQPGHAASAETE